MGGLSTARTKPQTAEQIAATQAHNQNAEAARAQPGYAAPAIIGYMPNGDPIYDSPHDGLMTGASSDAAWQGLERGGQIVGGIVGAINPALGLGIIGASTAMGESGKGTADDAANAVSSNNAGYDAAHGYGSSAGGNVGDPNANVTPGSTYLEPYINTPEELLQNYQYEYATPDMMYDPAAGAYVYADPYSIEAQYAALDGLQGMATGMPTAGDTARLQMSQQQQAMQERGQREAAMNQMQQRGMGGSGAELAAILSGQQGMMNANSMEAQGMNVAAMDRALRAQESAANLSSGIRGSSYDEASRRAQAYDAIQAGNTDYLRGLQQRNVNTQNKQEDATTSTNQDIFGQHGDVAGLANGGTTTSSNSDSGGNAGDAFLSFAESMIPYVADGLRSSGNSSTTSPTANKQPQVAKPGSQAMQGSYNVGTGKVRGS